MQLIILQFYTYLALYPMVRVSKNVSNLETISGASIRAQLNSNFITNTIQAPGFNFQRILDDDHETFFLRHFVLQEEMIYSRRLRVFFSRQQNDQFYGSRGRSGLVIKQIKDQKHEYKIQIYLNTLKEKKCFLSLKVDILLSKHKNQGKNIIIEQLQKQKQKLHSVNKQQILFKKIQPNLQHNIQDNFIIQLKIRFDQFFEARCLKKWKQKHKSSNQSKNHNL